MPEEKTGRTGRMLVTFPAGKAKSLLQALHSVAGLPRNEVADARDFTTRPSEGWLTPGVTLDRLGIAAFTPHLLEMSRFALVESLLAWPHLSVRPEYFMRRPATFRGGGMAAAPVGSIPSWLEDQRQTWALNAIGMDPTRAEGEGVRVALLDTGVDRAHPDLTQAIESVESFVPGKKADEDEVGHGTHCAGLIAGAQQPRIGPRYGVAPKARLVVVRVFDQREKTPELEILRAVEWAAAQGCHIISLSAGRDVDDRVMPEDEHLGETLARQGILLLAAAGNDSNRQEGRIEPTRAPANARHIPAIGAMNVKGRLWNESNGAEGPPHAQVDLVAPGVRVVSASPGGGTTPASGTSVATPLVAGVAAVLKSRAPALRGRELLAHTKALARRLMDDPASGAGAGLVQVR
jgi:hypothetical protein